MPLRLLAIGDMHLGRQPGRLPDALSESGLDLSPTGAWLRIVDKALEEKVDLVALAGDLVDQEDNLFEAYGPLETGINRLVEAGIDVVGISGNHDVVVLPKLAKQLSAFKLLGANGQWETHTLEKDSERLTLHGWSFPKASVTESPLTGHRFVRESGLNLGLLHCDRDQPDSSYAPVSSAELKNARLDGWLLGHIHKPDALGIDNISGYLGSVTGLHVGETGVRGPWLIAIEQGRVVEATQWSLAPLVWLPMDLDITNLTDTASVFDHFLQRLKDIATTLIDHDVPPDAVGIRLRLVGETDIADQAMDAFADKSTQNWSVLGIGHVFLESIADATRATVDLEQLAQQSSHLGQLAKALLSLDQPHGDPHRQALIDNAHEWLAPQSHDARWQALEKPDLSEAMVVEQLKTAGHRLLRELLAQSRAWAK